MKIKIIKKVLADQYIDVSGKLGLYADIKNNLRPLLSVDQYNELNNEETLLLADRLIKSCDMCKVCMKRCTECIAKFVAQGLSYEKSCFRIQSLFSNLMGFQEYAKSHLSKKYIDQVNVAAEKARKSMVLMYNKYCKYGSYEGFDAAAEERCRKINEKRNKKYKNDDEE